MSKKPSDELLILKEISEKMDSLIKINVMNLLKGKTMTEQVGLLDEYNFTNLEIAKIVGTSRASVRSMKNQYKKQKK